MRRVSVVGNSGSGKTTLAVRVAERLRVPYLELDAIQHQAGWLPMDPDEFHARVDAHTAGVEWVVDGNYAVVRDMVWSRADTVLWLDPSRAIVMWQIIQRTLRRVATGRELWHGNRESWRNVFTAEPEKSVIAWAWTRHRLYRATYLAAMSDPAWAHLDFVRLRSRSQARRLLDSCPLATMGSK